MREKFALQHGDHTVPVSSGVIALCFGVIASGCGGSGSSMPMTPSSSTGTVSVSISDPPSCRNPNGTFEHVYITVRSVQAHTSANATDSTPGWQELAPHLSSKPIQVDLFSTAQTNCVLAQLGSASLPAGDYQQIRLLLVSNSPGANDVVPSINACAGNGYNCVVLADNTIHELALSSEANTGLKIPPGQIVGGPLSVVAGQSVDFNIDFNACASIVQQGNGGFRLKPTLTAGQISPNNSGVAGQIVDAANGKAITGTVLVAIEQPDKTGIDRIVMEATADSSGNFRFCPLPMGMFDIVVVALGSDNLPYNATVVLNVPNGTNLSAIPLKPETGATGPAILSGFVTASTASAGAEVDLAIAALQTVSAGSSSSQLTIPLQTIAATSTNPEIDSTGVISISSNTNCPGGSPAIANCGSYTLIVPGSNPSVGVFSSSGFSYSAPAAGDVLFTVDVAAALPDSGGVADCMPSEIATSSDENNQPLRVVAGSTTQVARIDLTGCT